MVDKLQGDVERVTYHNAETGFSVLRVRVLGRGELVTVVGTATSVSAGERVEAQGSWVFDRQHGHQFKSEELTTSHPASAAGIERYLASGAVRSVGPKLAERIVAAYRDQALHVLEETPHLLLNVKGIGEARLQRISKSWEEQKEVRKLILFLTEYGIASRRAIRIYRTYGHEAIAKIKQNPYQLADEVRGIGFKTADELAGRLGLDPNSPERARAAVRFALHELATQGHTGSPESVLLTAAAELIEVDEGILQSAVNEVVQRGAVVREMIDGEPWLYLTHLHRAEQGIADAVGRIRQAEPHPLPAIDTERAVAWVQGEAGIQLAPAQQEAIRAACRSKFLVVTGGPGVGKTTLVRSILDIFEARGLDCVLAAPTGRASKRLTETTGRPAKTVHRLLEFDPALGEFHRNEFRPLEGDLFIFDETSMLDVVLGQVLLRAIPPSGCVVLVGDVEQLPSVGPGTVLRDLIDSDTVPVVRLTQVFRQASESNIIAAANAINTGALPEKPYTEELSDFYFVEVAEPEAICDMITRLVTERIPDRFQLDPRRDIQVLTPMNRSVLGARHLNQVLQRSLTGDTEVPEVERFGWSFRVGDRVIQNENNYDRDVFNGDLGLIEKINRIEQTVTVSFDGDLKTYDFGDLDELSLAYVLTIHKSQGSEFPCVVIPLHTQHFVMLQRNLLYTAVTRGKQLVVIVGTSRALRMAVDRADPAGRRGNLKLRLQRWSGEAEVL